LLIFHPHHATLPSQLSTDEWNTFVTTSLPQCAIEAAVHPHHINVASLGNQIDHLHWHIIPRYEGDSRWGPPIWMTTEAEMEKISLPTEEHAALVCAIRAKII
jgi:diadenosine tetraphosphate (Ap4A) HIT family hydrolase